MGIWRKKKKNQDPPSSDPSSPPPEPSKKTSKDSRKPSKDKSSKKDKRTKRNSVKSKKKNSPDDPRTRVCSKCLCTPTDVLPLDCGHNLCLLCAHDVLKQNFQSIQQPILTCEDEQCGLMTILNPALMNYIWGIKAYQDGTLASADEKEI
jgi:hypothetical protein